MAPRTDPAQEAVLASDEAHLLVVAPPGTGKTSLAARLAVRDAATLPPHQRVLLLTFSNQARGQLEREVARVAPPEARRMVVVTNYHSFFWAQVRAHRRALGLPDRVRLSSWGRRKALLRGASGDIAQLGRNDDHVLERFAEQRHIGVAPENPLDEQATAALLECLREEHARGNLTFDDLGALFWDLIDRFPSVRRGLRARYPVVIADEHQDASSIQDALVRELGPQRRVVLGDPMQLIHGWRGADSARFDAHRGDCDHEYELATPHRWHGAPDVGAWLLAVRHRLEGANDPAPTPRGIRVRRADPGHGEAGLRAEAKYAVLEAFQAGCLSVAVLARSGEDVGKIRDYLTREGHFPRQLGSRDLFEDGLDLAENLAAMSEREAVDRALDVVFRFMPSLPATLRRQIDGRLTATGSRKAGCGADAKRILEAMDGIFFHGPSAYFSAVVSACEASRSRGLHVPRLDEYGLYQAVVASGEPGITEQLDVFSERLGALSRRSHQVERGLMTMTIHQAKGREFDAVVLLGANARHFGDDPEAQRLFYVAITRGVSRWTIIATRGQESPLVASLGLA